MFYTTGIVKPRIFIIVPFKSVRNFINKFRINYEINGLVISIGIIGVFDIKGGFIRLISPVIRFIPVIRIIWFIRFVEVIRVVRFVIGIRLIIVVRFVIGIWLIIVIRIWLIIVIRFIILRLVPLILVIIIRIIIVL